jgi:AraC family transcriptional regulator
MNSTSYQKPPKGGPRQGLQHSVLTYGRVLGAAGGMELDAMMRGEGRGAVCAALYTSPPYDLRVPALPVGRVSVNMTRACVTGGLVGERQRRFEAKRHSLFVTPAGTAVQWHKESPSRHLNIYFQPEDFGGGGDDSFWLAHDEPVFNAAVPGVRDLADELVAELSRRDALAVEAADSLARLLLVRLARRQPRDAGASNPLTPQVLAKVRDYVEEHLSQRILVADLAAVAGLSPNGFAHAYSERTRQPPHQFVLGLRLERAASLLRQPCPGLAEVAAACGFASQQHLTHTMRRRLGTTPARYRDLHADRHASDKATPRLTRDLP